MTGDQWFTLLKTVIWLAFTLVVLYGIYRIMIHGNGSDDNGT